MRYLFTVITLASTILFCASCSSSSALLSNADAEAGEQAQKFVEAQLARCGDSYYGIRKVANDNSLYQFKNPKTSVKSEVLSQADKLNGVEWKGGSDFSAETWRSYGKSGGWGSWRQGFMSLGVGLSVRMIKHNGQWKFGTSGDLKPDSYEKVDCSKLPQ
jgi:hypothetical protein